MKLYLYAILFFLSPLVTSAQNYQCLQSGVNRYFTNDLYYLRGVRIDSVRQQGDTTIYYPYHTARGPYLANPYEPVLDSTGSSWLGKNVLQYPDGTFVFNNMFDTVFIKTQANFGDSWIFYSDTTQDYYLATITGINITNVLDSIDTVKTITLASYHGTNINTADSLNGFEILLSKNHGFVQVFDLYTFPYHMPDTSYYQGLDYYLDEAVYAPGNPLGAQNGILIPEKNNAIFKLTQFINPTQAQLYDWQPGDVYQNSYYSSNFNGSYVGYPYEYSMDTITSRQNYNDSVVYTGKGEINFLASNSNQGPTVYYYNTTYGVDTMSYANRPLFDSDFIPEEYHQNNIYYYNMTDTGWCLNSALYAWIKGDIQNGTYAPFPGETITTKYKTGLGEIFYEDHDIADLTDEKNELLYAYKNGISCGNYINLALPVVNKNGSLQIFPNPAYDQLTIKTDIPNKVVYKMTLKNMLGAVVCSINSNKQNQVINVSNLPSGLYIVNVTDSDGLITNQKIIINH